MNHVLIIKVLKKLKTFIDDLQYFKYLDSPLLENVHLDFKSFGKAEKTEVLRKLINTKTLKKLEFERFDLADTEISKIERINTSLMELKLEFISKTLKFDLSYLKEKFPNLCRISIICYIQNKDKNNSIELKMREYSENNINILYNNGNLNMSLEPYKDLEEIIVFWFESINLSTLPFFQNNLTEIFTSLVIFRFQLPNISSNDLNNLYITIDKMPNLKEFGLITNCKEIKKDDANKFIIKLLSLDLNFIEFNAKEESWHEQYSFEELKILFPSFNPNHFKEIEIYKLKEYKKNYNKNNYNLL